MVRAPRQGDIPAAASMPRRRPDEGRSTDRVAGRSCNYRSAPAEAAIASVALSARSWRGDGGESARRAPACRPCTASAPPRPVAVPPHAAPSIPGAGHPTSAEIVPQPARPRDPLRQFATHTPLLRHSRSTHTTFSGGISWYGEYNSKR